MKKIVVLTSLLISVILVNLGFLMSLDYFTPNILGYLISWFDFFSLQSPRADG